MKLSWPFFRCNIDLGCLRWFPPSAGATLRNYRDSMCVVPELLAVRRSSKPCAKHMYLEHCNEQCCCKKQSRHVQICCNTSDSTFLHTMYARAYEGQRLALFADILVCLSL